MLVHTIHGLVYAVWIASAAFAASTMNWRRRLATRSGPLRAFVDVTLPLAVPGLMASAIFVFLKSLDEFTGTYFVGVPDVHTLPLLLYTASAGGNYQIASITALILLVPSIGFMFVVERFLRADGCSRGSDGELKSEGRKVAFLRDTRRPQSHALLTHFGPTVR